MCVCARMLHVYVCLGGLVISVLCQLMRDERGHLFRGAGWRAVGWDMGMGDVVMEQLLGVGCVHDV